MPERLPAVGPEGQGGLLIGRSLLLHERDQFPSDKWKSDEHRRQHDAWHGKKDLDAM